MIGEKRALEIVKEFSEKLKDILSDNLLAVILVGSLADGDYRPGRSDIDTVVITKRQNPESALKSVEDLSVSFRDRYSIPKGIGAVLVSEPDMRPHYDHDVEIVPEILRVKLQGKVILGYYDISTIPFPGRKDFENYARVFYSWLRRNYIDQRPEEARTLDATVNVLLYELKLLIWFRSSEYVLRKKEIVRKFLEVEPSTVWSNELKEMEHYVVNDGEELEIHSLENLLINVSDYVRSVVNL